MIKSREIVSNVHQNVTKKNQSNLSICKVYHGYFNYLEVLGQSLQGRSVSDINVAFVLIHQEIIHAESTE